MTIGRKHGFQPVPAVVLGSGLNGLGVARSLGAKGLPVFMLDKDSNRPEMHTRYARRIEISALHGEGLIRDLIELGENCFTSQRPVLLLTQEQSVRAVAAAQDVLTPFYRCMLPSHGLLETLMHKEGFDRLAAKAGLRVPHTVHVHTLADMEAALALSSPLVIKPALHTAAYERAFKKAYRVRDPLKAENLLKRILEVLPDIVVQEWIPGNDADIYFCLQQLSREGQPVASYAGRKIRSWPPAVGGTASCTTALNHQQLATLTADFFKKVGMCGLAGMEFKRHAITGEFVAIEPTVGRTDYQEEVASLNGVNLPYAYYCSVLGLDFIPFEQDGMGIIWRDRNADIQSMGHPEQSVREWPAGHGKIYDALWRYNDPYPWAVAQWQRVMRKGHSMLGKIINERGPQ